MSLDGYIAGPNGEADWIVMDPSFDFGAMMSQFDTLLLGRRTFEPMARVKRTEMPGMKTIVVSTTMRATDYPGITVIGSDVEEQIAALRTAPGKDIWLFGGGELFRRLLDAGLPLLPPPFRQAKLRLAGQQAYPTGVIALQYAIEGAA